MNSLLAVSHLTVISGSGHLVNNISFNIGFGERVGLIGESGSGKSLTSLSILGLLPRALAVGGEIFYEGENLLLLGDRQLQSIRGAKIALVFQDPTTALDPLMKIGKQLEQPIKRNFGLRGHALKEAILQALTKVKLADPIRIIDSYPHEISGGEKQRVAIAAALACKPKLLVVDEPTTALDVTVQREILLLLDALVREEELSLLFISHDIAVISQIADRVLVMNSGAIVEDGSIQNILNNPQHPYTQKLIASARALDSALGATL